MSDLGHTGSLAGSPCSCNALLLVILSTTVKQWCHIHQNQNYCESVFLDVMPFTVFIKFSVCLLVCLFVFSVFVQHLENWDMHCLGRTLEPWVKEVQPALFHQAAP